ncbi:endonuclease V [Candidatus Woesearchaeota archaeon]|nr:endonuclease V [Candidatus Woesearchaeota archaeon]
MDLYELKKEQYKLAPKVILKDNFNRIKTIGGVDCVQYQNKLIACVVVCEFPSLKFLEKQTAILPDPLPFRPGFLAYREMPAIIEAFNNLEQEPDLLLVDGSGVLHPRKFGMASHLGLALNIPTIGITKKISVGRIENSKVYLEKELVGFEVETREHANKLYISPGHLVSLGTTLKTIQQSIKVPHKLPEPIHLAHRLAKKKLKKLQNVN